MTSKEESTTNATQNDDGAVEQEQIIVNNDVAATATIVNVATCNEDATSNKQEETVATAGKATGKVASEFKDITERDAWNKIYYSIRDRSEKYARENKLTTFNSERNERQNRYRDVHPYDHSRVVLQRSKNDYINANFVQIKQANRQYILTQGPLQDTVGKFWLMIWEQNSRAILMLNNLLEKKQIKCYRYWPTTIGANHALNFTDLKLSVELLKTEQYTDFECRCFKLTDDLTKKSREIMQFHYTTWPDFGTPETPSAFLTFWKQVRKSGALEPTVGPVVVHCSAGIGRSGTFCLVDACLVIFEKEGENKVSIQDVLLEMRHSRMGLIQSTDQLYFSYKAVVEGIKVLQDPNFLKQQETPISINKGADSNATDTDANSELSIISGPMDENPPPLPPRSQSLLPSTESEIIFGKKGNDELKEVLNNLMIGQTMSRRPLPPLPQLPTHKRKKTTSLQDDHDYDDYNEYDHDDYNEYDHDDYEHYDDTIDIDDDDYDEDHDEDDVNSEFAEDNLFNNIDDSDLSIYSIDDKSNDDVNANALEHDVMNNVSANKHEHVQDNSKSTDTNNANSTSTNQWELRHRKRAERKDYLVNLIKDIKRKQRETETDASNTSNKRFASLTNMSRGSWLALATGVFLGTICVYAYTKMG